MNMHVLWSQQCNHEYACSSPVTARAVIRADVSQELPAASEVRFEQPERNTGFEGDEGGRNTVSGHIILQCSRGMLLEAVMMTEWWVLLGQHWDEIITFCATVSEISWRVPRAEGRAGYGETGLFWYEKEGELSFWGGKVKAKENADQWKAWQQASCGLLSFLTSAAISLSIHAGWRQAYRGREEADLPASEVRVSAEAAWVCQAAASENEGMGCDYCWNGVSSMLQPKWTHWILPFWQMQMAALFMMSGGQADEQHMQRQQQQLARARGEIETLVQKVAEMEKKEVWTSGNRSWLFASPHLRWPSLLPGSSCPLRGMTSIWGRGGGHIYAKMWGLSTRLWQSHNCSAALVGRTHSNWVDSGGLYTWFLC